MNTTSNATAKTTKTARPVTDILLELAYHMHATQVVAVLPAQPTHPTRRRVLSERSAVVAGRSA